MRGKLPAFDSEVIAFQRPARIVASEPRSPEILDQTSAIKVEIW